MAPPLALIVAVTAALTLSGVALTGRRIDLSETIAAVFSGIVVASLVVFARRGDRGGA